MKAAMRGCWAGLAVAITGSLAPEAAAVQGPEHLAGRPAFELAQGAVRNERELTWDHTPAAARGAFGILQRDMGPSRAVWDRATGVPSRIWGSSMEAPGVIDSPKLALRHAQRMLARHLRLLAPGTTIADFALVSNDLDAGMRTIGFAQWHRGERVVGGQISFRFKNDRLFMIGSEARPDVHVAHAALIDAQTASDAARAWLLSDVADSVSETSLEGPMVLPLIGEHDVAYRRVLAVTFDSEPLGRWRVYVDAHDGSVVAREQLLRFASGTLLYEPPERHPGRPRAQYPAANAYITADGAPVTTDASGALTWGGNSDASVIARATGDHADVQNQAGGNASATLPLAPNGSAVWLDESEFADAQIATFAHLSHVMIYSKSFAPELQYLDTQLQANVNINDACNAFYNGSSVNFFRQNGGCGNTGRIADVIYHELGHGLHDHGIIEGVGNFDGALSEGLSDFLAATITNDSGMGRGFHLSDDPLREMNPQGFENHWPEDIGEIHYTGIIIAGALWDMRQFLMDAEGDAGVAAANIIFYQALRRAVDIPTMYFEALAADDDDGDLGNGTPHLCGIIAGFEPHGLHHVSAQGGGKESVAPPQLDAYRVSLGLVGAHYDCNPNLDASAEVEWRLREQTDTGGVMAMQLGPTGFEADLPAMPDGSVVQYRVTLVLEGETSVYPDNPADPWYEMFVGHVEPLYCTDFETDAFAEGWSHALDAGAMQEGADDWQWGMPQAPSDSGDPMAAFSGDNVVGNDLGIGNYNGLYQSDKHNHVESPAVDTTGYANVRLQYRRWLNVEDAGFDRASISADGEPVWQNLDSDTQTSVNHLDKEWRFQDVDISSQAADGSAVLRWDVQSDGGMELGGWTIDDVCVVAWIPTVCGDGLVTGLEECDEGAANADDADACRSDCVSPTCGDGIIDTGETCDDANLVDGDGCEGDCSIDEDVLPGSGGNDGGGLGASDDSCGCRLEPSRGDGALRLALLALGLVLWRRRRR